MATHPPNHDRPRHGLGPHGGGPILVACVLMYVVAAPTAQASFTAFESGQVRPLALSPDGGRLFAVNTPDNRLEILTVTDGGVARAAAVPVGLEPVAVAARNDSEVWVVNHLSDSVSIVDVASDPPRVVRTLLVGDEPRDIVFAGPGGRRAFITAAHRGQHLPVDPQLTTPGIGRADVWVFDADDLGDTLGGSPLTIMTLFGDTPRGLAVTPDGGTVYAAVFHSGNRTTTVSEGAVCDGGPLVAPCSVRGVLMPGGLPGPDSNVQGIPRPETGLIVKFNPLSGAWEDELARDWSAAVRFDLPDQDVFAIDANADPPVQTDAFAGVGTVLFNLAVNPISRRLYASNTEARNEVRFEGPGVFGGSSVRGHLHETRITVIDPDAGTVAPRHLNKHIDYAIVPSPAETKRHSLATPLGMQVSDDGATLYVAAFGSSAIGVFDTASLENDTFVPDAGSQIALCGGGPSGLALDGTRRRLYVLTRFDNAVSVVDTAARVEIDSLALHNPEPSEIVAGRPFLYDARLTSSNGEASCATCHVFGHMDDLAWDLGDPDAPVLFNPNPNRAPDFGVPPELHPMKGPMTTQTLRGLAGHGPMHWRGDRTGGNDVNGDALDEAAAFAQFNVAFEGLLGRDAALSPREMRAFADFALRLSMPPNPIRALDNSLTADQEAGRAFFRTAPVAGGNTCVHCHALDPASGFFGTDGFSSDDINFDSIFQFRTFKVPQLRNMYEKVGMFGMPAVSFIFPGDNAHMGAQIRGFGFLHDGSDDTMLRHLRLGGDVNARPGFLFPGETEQRQVEQFLLAFDSNLAPIVGQQITLAAANVAVAGPRVDLLVARAQLGECEVVATGVIAGEARGFYRDASGGFVSDRRREAARSDAELRALATAAEPLTYTCAPVGSGARMAIDRDEDGAFDRDELDRGSDPGDATSVPLPCPGDCNDDYQVGIEELVRGVGIALGNRLPEACVPFDANGDHTVTISELVQGVRRALEGCRA